MRAARLQLNERDWGDLKKTLRLRAFAKINTGLRILHPRPDSYHEIRTIYQTIALHDRLGVSLSKAPGDIVVECDNPAIPGGPGNLVYRACQAWAQARDWLGAIRVQIAKTIPAGAFDTLIMPKAPLKPAYVMIV